MNDLEKRVWWKTVAVQKMIASPDQKNDTSPAYGIIHRVSSSLFLNFSISEKAI